MKFKYVAENLFVLGFKSLMRQYLSSTQVYPIWGIQDVRVLLQNVGVGIS